MSAAPPSATPTATRRLAERFLGTGLRPAAYRILGRTGLSVSALGFGSYRVDTHHPEHREALDAALDRGCNLLDTSTNYTDGESESCLGAVLAGGVSAGRLEREEIVVVSKIGYVQGGNLTLARQREAAGDPFPEMVKVSPGCWHCVHPRFLEDQLGRSLARLGLQKLDVCLLHNPEYFLEQAHRKGEPVESAREEFYRRMRQAFSHLEREVEAGRTAWYGVSSNSFGADPADPEATSLGKMLEAARRAAVDAGLPPEEHHFAVAQLPMNLYEHGPLTMLKEGTGNLSTLRLASQEDIGILVNRPLNAFHQGELIRLADFPDQAPALTFKEALAKVSAREREFDAEIGARLQSEGGGPVPRLFDWGQQLEGLEGRATSVEHWDAIQEQQILPRLYHAVEALRAQLPEEAAAFFEPWLQGYLPALSDLLALFRSQAAERSRRRSTAIAARLDPHLPPPLRGQTLSRKALHCVASVSGVTCVLNGMRRGEYVADAMEILKWDPLAGAEALFRLP
ncbi:MAG TPA: aldo/keto reductase [Candidatus Polarisedimenticolia bacterium]|nr:aldo/keto reductase [Candidatus Polarisedimenticolia bacterium]